MLQAAGAIAEDLRTPRQNLDACCKIWVTRNLGGEAAIGGHQSAVTEQCRRQIEAVVDGVAKLARHAQKIKAA